MDIVLTCIQSACNTYVLLLGHEWKDGTQISTQTSFTGIPALVCASVVCAHIILAKWYEVPYAKVRLYSALAIENHYAQYIVILLNNFPY